jgi:hypothetical protein
MSKVITVTTEMPDCSNNVTATNSSILLDERCVNFTTNHSASVSFTDVDGLQPLTLYECIIQLTVNNYTSAKGIPTSIYTPAPTGMNYLHHLYILSWGSSWSWSYSSWIYNYLCNQLFITTNSVSLNSA